MNALSPKLFSECFVTWVNGLRDSDPDIVAVDGKTSRRTHAMSKGRKALHMVSAWASRQRLVLGQEATRACPCEGGGKVQRDHRHPAAARAS